MKKIDFIIGSLQRGGAERVISLLANFYASNNFDVNIVLLLNNNIGYKIYKNVKIVDFSGNTNKKYMHRVPFWLKSLRKHFLSRKPDIIVSFVCRVNILTIMAYKKVMKKINARLVVSERNDPRYDGRGSLAKIMCKRLYKYPDAIIMQTQTIKSLFPKKIQQKCHIIFNPIDRKIEPLPIKMRKNLIITTGRLAEQKNQKLLISAFADLIKTPTYQHIELHIYGDGPLKQELQKLIYSLNIQKNTFIHPNIDNIQDKVREAKLFVLSSLYEGLSNSLMEAISLGVPVISTPVSGASDLIINGYNGFILNSFEKKELLDTMIKVINLSDNEYQNMCDNNLVMYEKFKPELVFKQYDDVISKNTD